jgi:hypothetical protein
VTGGWGLGVGRLWDLKMTKQMHKCTRGGDRLLANGVARSAARRKTGGLQWHGFLRAFGARNGRKIMGHGAP